MAKRNAKGAGHIGKKTVTRNGKTYTYWVGVIEIPNEGKRIQRTVTGKTQKEVRQRITEIQGQLDRGIYTTPVKMTVEDWLNIWHSEYINDVKDTTRVAYRQHLDNHILPALGAVKLSKLTAVLVQKFYNDLSRGDKPLSAKTVRNIHGILHHALKQAVRLGYIQTNPCEGCSLPRPEKAKIEPLDTPEIAALLNVLGDDVYSTIIKVDMFTGMRSGEILGLQWSCVDFEKGTIIVDKQLRRPRVKGEAYRLASVKNNKPRTIQPAPYVMQLLKDQHRRQTEQRFQAGALWDDSDIPDLVFTYEDGKHIDACIVLRHLKKMLKAAGLPDKRFHDLRHTFAVTSLQAGDDVKTVQENLGHHTAAFTLDQYGHVTDTMRKASAARMETLINSLK